MFQKPKRKLSDENLLSPKKEVGGENNRSLESGTRWKVTLAVMILLIFAASLIAFASMSNGEIITAKAEVLKAVKGGQPSGSMGIIEFSQDTSTNKVKITGELTGLTAGEHGFHIHAKGDLGNGCVDAGGHYNPENKTHGAPMDNVRHVGDLGNIKAGAEKATITIEDGVIQLKGPHSIIGRALVVHSGVDDLGKGGDAESLKTGNAGSRVGCGVVMKSAFTAKPLSSLLILSLALISFRILF